MIKPIAIFTNFLSSYYEHIYGFSSIISLLISGSSLIIIYMNKKSIKQLTQKIKNERKENNLFEIDMRMIDNHIDALTTNKNNPDHFASDYITKVIKNIRYATKKVSSNDKKEINTIIKNISDLSLN